MTSKPTDMNPMDSKVLIKEATTKLDSAMKMCGVFSSCLFPNCNKPVLASEILAHSAIHHGSGEAAELFEMFQGETLNMKCSYKHLEKFTKHNIVLLQIAYAGLNESPQSRPAARGICKKNFPLSENYKRFESALPIFVMARLALLDQSLNGALKKTQKNEYNLIIWCTSVQTAKPLSCFLKIYDGNKKYLTSKFINIRSVQETQDVAEFYGKNTNKYLEIAKNALKVCKDLTLDIEIWEYDEMTFEDKERCQIGYDFHNYTEELEEQVNAKLDDFCHEVQFCNAACSGEQGDFNDASAVQVIEDHQSMDLMSVSNSSSTLIACASYNELMSFDAVCKTLSDSDSEKTFKVEEEDDNRNFSCASLPKDSITMLSDAVDPTEFFAHLDCELSFDRPSGFIISEHVTAEDVIPSNNVEPDFLQESSVLSEKEDSVGDAIDSCILSGAECAEQCIVTADSERSCNPIDSNTFCISIDKELSSENSVSFHFSEFDLDEESKDEISLALDACISTDNILLPSVSVTAAELKPDGSNNMGNPDDSCSSCNCLGKELSEVGFDITKFDLDRASDFDSCTAVDRTSSCLSSADSCSPCNSLGQDLSNFGFDFAKFELDRASDLESCNASGEPIICETPVDSCSSWNSPDLSVNSVSFDFDELELDSNDSQLSISLNANIVIDNILYNMQESELTNNEQ